MNIKRLSSIYDVRYISKSNLNEILNIMKENPQFYKYTDSKPTIDDIINDMTITPPGIDLSKKHYIGFYKLNELIAIMDLIDGYPTDDTSYIGFFMINKKYQGQGIGSIIINELEKYLKEDGKMTIELAIDKGNPQSTNFWQKNGFVVFDEVKKENYIKLKAKKNLLK